MRFLYRFTAGHTLVNTNFRINGESASTDKYIFQISRGLISETQDRNNDKLILVHLKRAIIRSPNFPHIDVAPVPPSMTTAMIYPTSLLSVRASIWTASCAILHNLNHGPNFVLHILRRFIQRWHTYPLNHRKSRDRLMRNRLPGVFGVEFWTFFTFNIRR